MYSTFSLGHPKLGGPLPSSNPLMKSVGLSSRARKNADQKSTMPFPRSKKKKKTKKNQKHPIPPIEPRSRGLDISAEHGLSLRGSYRQGYSTTYNTRSDIKVVCNGYIPAHISNCNSTGGTETFTSQHKSRPCTIRGTKPICIHVRCTRVNIATFWHGF